MVCYSGHNLSLLLLLLCSTIITYAWIPLKQHPCCKIGTSISNKHQRQHHHHQHQHHRVVGLQPLYISNFFQDKTNSGVELPRDVKEAVQKCREATQEALKQRISRMDIEFPVGTRFGVEKGGEQKKKNKGGGGGMVVAPTREDIIRSDRELARIFVEMFQPVGADRIVVAFVDENQADQAKKQWSKDYSAAQNCRVLSLNRRNGSASKKKIKTKGFAAKLAAEVDDALDESGPFQLPPSTEVALFVAPGPKELVVIEKICDAAGMGTLVILLNARLSNVSKFLSPRAEDLFLKEFETVYRLTAAPQEFAPGCLLFRAFPGPWAVARKPAVGQPKTILIQQVKPSGAEIEAAFQSLQLSNVEKTVEGWVENVANWLK